MGNSNPEIQFTHDRVIQDDGSITFQCATDLAQWPWLTLHPHHPISLQNLQYWASVECGIERGTFDGKKWTALTWTRWTCGDPDVGGYTRGIADSVEENGKLVSRITLFDGDDQEICSMLSKGVEFRTRDFESWREKAKQNSAEAIDISDFAFADPNAVGSVDTGPSLISALQEGETPHASGLMTMENAFPPAHRFMSGSGDHVNATHLAEAAHQFLHLLENGRTLRVTGGEMRFTSYVELGREFRVTLVDRREGSITADVTQGERNCTQVTLNFEVN